MTRDRVAVVDIQARVEKGVQGQQANYDHVDLAGSLDHCNESLSGFEGYWSQQVDHNPRRKVGNPEEEAVIQQAIIPGRVGPLDNGRDDLCRSAFFAMKKVIPARIMTRRKAAASPTIDAASELTPRLSTICTICSSMEFRRGASREQGLSPGVEWTSHLPVTSRSCYRYPRGSSTRFLVLLQGSVVGGVQAAPQSLVPAGASPGFSAIKARMKGSRRRSRCCPNPDCSLRAPIRP